ncbi:MAG: AMP-binding protein, partial [Phycisphaerales bacterium]|nr:AMP-binding protein [Phycisphaerales bacterium]
TMKGCPAIKDKIVLSWDEFMAKGDEVDDATFDERMDRIDEQQLATLIYTSGTTGPPKGVMLSHQNLAWTANAARDLVDSGPTDWGLSYLPLSHIAEQMFTVHAPATTGASVYYAESIEKVADNLKEVQPTIFFGVPRIWEKMHAGINAGLQAATGAKAVLAKWARKVGAEASAKRNRGEAYETLQYKAAEKVIFSKLKARVGLANARVCVSGAAPIAREVLEFFASLDIIVLEVYGQSEDCGPTSFNQPGRTKFGTVGPKIPGVEVKIAEDGEICVQGPNVFLGYYKEPEATAETLIDGWLHSGDLGEFDSDGFLKITGRKKEIIITAGGKNLSP